MSATAECSGLLGPEEASTLKGGCVKQSCVDDSVCRSGPACSSTPQGCIVCGRGMFLWWNKKCVDNKYGSKYCDSTVDKDPGCGKKLDGHCIKITTGFSCSQDGGEFYGDCGTRDDCTAHD